MINPSRLVISITVFTSWLACAAAHGERSVYEETQQLSQTASQEFYHTPAEEDFVHTSIDITANAFESNLKQTNWQFGAEFLIYDTEYGSVNFQNTEGDDELAAGLRFNHGWESDVGYGIRIRTAKINGKGLTDDYAWNFSVPGDVFSIQGFGFQGASPTAAGRDILEIDTTNSSIDLFKHIRHERFDILFGIGISLASVKLNAPTELIRNSIIAGGYSLFSEGKYTVYHSDVSELSLVGSGHIALLEGEWEARIDNLFLDMNSDLTITEGAVGLEWKRDIGRSILVLRAQYENQIWNSDVTSDLMFNGAALRAGLTW